MINYDNFANCKMNEKVKVECSNEYLVYKLWVRRALLLQYFSDIATLMSAALPLSSCQSWWTRWVRPSVCSDLETSASTCSQLQPASCRTAALTPAIMGGKYFKCSCSMRLLKSCSENTAHPVLSETSLAFWSRLREG